MSADTKFRLLGLLLLSAVLTSRDAIIVSLLFAYAFYVVLRYVRVK